MTTPEPRAVGFHRFKGTRCVRVGQYEHIHTILSVVWLNRREREMAVQMAGKQRYFRLDSFEGEWQFINVERMAA